MTKLYLISPPKIDLETFSIKLSDALSSNKVSIFQLRLKDISYDEIAYNAKKLIKICDNHKVPFIMNDNVDLALEIGASGVHLGDDDDDIKYAKKQYKAKEKHPTKLDYFVIGASCYDSKDKILKATEDGADYVSIGAFFESKTKQSKGKATMELLKWCNKSIKIPKVCIGGINNENYKQLLDNKTDFIAIISYIWDHEKGIKFALESLESIKKIPSSSISL